ncbi:hypothetical protein Mapa_005059 [Marchantia paleacea]|nr:hypothetical protein Mapa_005059 [Marchantia paleacea]
MLASSGPIGTGDRISNTRLPIMSTGVIGVQSPPSSLCIVATSISVTLAQIIRERRWIVSMHTTVKAPIDARSP